MHTQSLMRMEQPMEGFGVVAGEFDLATETEVVADEPTGSDSSEERFAEAEKWTG